MDVKCATCREPYDTYHMRHDELWSSDLGEREIEAALAQENPLKVPGVREAFERLGWRFAGNSLYAIRRCPCCKANEEANGAPDPQEAEDRAQKRAIVAELLEGDDDGIAAMLEDMDWLEGD